MDINESVTTYTYENNPISFDNGEEVMINATEMAKPFGKKVAEWLRLPSTKEFLDVLTEVRKSHIDSLLVTRRGGDIKSNNKSEQGTWMHRDVAIEFARWLSPEFAIWCNDRVFELVSYGRPVKVEAPKEEKKILLPTNVGKFEVNESHANEVMKKQLFIYKKLIDILVHAYPYNAMTFEDFVEKIINKIFLAKVWDPDKFLMELINKHGIMYKSGEGYYLDPILCAQKEIYYVREKLYISNGFQIRVLRWMLEEIENNKES